MPTKKLSGVVLLFLSAWSFFGRAENSEDKLTPHGGSSLNVRAFGAVGDGVTLDHAAINGAIDACAESGGGEVVFPAGRYVSGTVRLRSHVALWLSAGARLIGSTNLTDYGQPLLPPEMPEAKWGKWHRGLIVGENLEEVLIGGPGVIDGNKVADPTGEEHMRGPHAIAFANCRHVSLRDVTIVDAANYAVFFQASDDVEFLNMKIIGGWDGIHWRGGPERWCKHVVIRGCRFFTGDDAIAGRYWDHTVITDCLINSSCNGLRLIGPARHLIVNNCLFYGPGVNPHRTSRERQRTNMLSGIILQPGAWDETRGLLDDILISRVTMDNVASPITIWTKTNNPVGRITIEDLSATGIYRAAMSVESWSDAPITNVVVRNARLEFVGGGKPEAALFSLTRPAVDARVLPAWGFYGRNIERVTLEDVRFSLQHDDLRPVIVADAVTSFALDSVKFKHVQGVDQPIVTTNGTTLSWPNESARQ